MSKTIIIVAALAAITGLSAVAPAHAATRSVGITMERFADRCADQGGALLDAGPSLTCQTPKTVIECGFLYLNNATCAWPGIENQIAVNRIIGMPDSVALNDGSDSNPVAGGAPGQGGLVFKQPKFPIKWK